MPYALRGLLAVAGRVLLCVIFLMSGAGHAMDFQHTAEAYLAPRGLSPPLPQVLLAGAIAFLGLGSLLVVAGFQARIGALLLFLFLAAVTPLFHDFWNYADQAARQAQMINFLKNVALAGAMLMIMANGPGPFSLDARAGREAP